MQISHSFSFGHTVPNSEGSSNELHAFCGSSVLPLDDRVVSLYCRIGGAAALVSRPIHQALEQCRRFAPLSEHAATVARSVARFGISAPEADRVLAELRAKGLMITPRSQAAWLGAHAQHSPGSPVVFVLRTCARPQLIRRALHSVLTAPESSLAACAAIVVADDSPDESDREKTRATVRDVSATTTADLPVHYADANILTSALRDLAKNEPLPVGLLGGGAPGNGYSPGAALNRVLLLFAGCRLVLMDDDAVLEYGHRAHPSQYVDVDSPPDIELFSQTANGTCVPGHFPHAAAAISEHLHRLGKRIGTIAAAEEAPIFQRPGTLAGGSQVRFTCSGVYGDPGTDNNRWIFALPRPQLEPLLKPEPDGQAALYSRCVRRSSIANAVATNIQLMTTTLSGIANDRPMPPTLPYGRNEDYLLGVAAQRLDPNDVSWNLPDALLHRPDPPRQWGPEDLRAPFVPGVGRFLASTLRKGAPSGSSFDHNLAAFQLHFRELAESPRDVLDERLAEFVFTSYSSVLSQLLAAGRTLADGTPRWLRALLNEQVDLHQRTLESQLSTPQLNDGPLYASGGAGEAVRRVAQLFADELPLWFSTWTQMEHTQLSHRLERIPRL